MTRITRSILAIALLATPLAAQTPRDTTQYVGMFCPRITYGVPCQYLSGTNIIYNVRDFGAKGDASTDDSRAIQLAIAAAANQGTGSTQLTGGIIYFPCGKYLFTSTIQIPVALNQGAVILRGSGMRCSYLVASGPTTNFTPTGTSGTPSLVLVGAAVPDPAGTFTNVTQYVGIEDLSVNGSLLTGAGNVRGVTFVECQLCWMTNSIIEVLPNSSTGLYLLGSTITGGLGTLTSAPHTRLSRFTNVIIASIGSGATSKPRGLIIQNADENDFYNDDVSVTTGLTPGNDSVFTTWIQLGRNNRFFGVLQAGDVTANKTQYVGMVFGPPQNEAGVANGSVLLNQDYGAVMEGFDFPVWNRADGSGNTKGNMVIGYFPSIYTVGLPFKDDNAAFCGGPGSFAFTVYSPVVGPPDGPMNYYGCQREPSSFAQQFSTVNNATPDISGGNVFTTNTTAATTITNLINGKVGQRVTLRALDSLTTIASNTNFLGLPGNQLLPKNSEITFLDETDGHWHLVSSSWGLSSFGNADAEVALTCGAGTTPAIDVTKGAYFTCNITANVAVTLGVPFGTPCATCSRSIFITFRNSSGGALTTAPTFNGAANGFKFGTVTNPANGTQVAYEFRWDGVQGFWYQVGAALASGI